LSKKKNSQDPQAERESQKYENPVASREWIQAILRDAEGPLTHMALCQRLGLDAESQIEALRRRLIAMERDGQLISNRKGAYAIIDKLDLVRGRVQGHRDGYGFVVPAGGGEDIYLTNRQMRKVFDGDEVLVRKGHTDFRGRTEGAIVEVVSSHTQRLVGRLHSERGIYFLRADNPRIFQDILIAPEDTMGAKKGQFITVEIIDHPFASKFPTGKIVEVLGEHLAPGMEIDVAIRSHAIPYAWPADVVSEAAVLPSVVMEADKRHRVDLRKLPLVTIDGEDARDFDDAVYCEKKKSGGWRLYVAIADVSHYVAVDSALDQEAVVRGNSVYFPDYVVPMLPEALSNGLCSLNPAVDRLCMVCEITVSAAGKLTGYLFYEAVMHSQARLTYTKVGQILAEQGKKRSGIRKEYAAVVPHLDELYALYTALRSARELRGAIDFETTETRILFDEQRKIERIIPVVRNDAHKLIEECMLAANVCAAKFLEEMQLPALYRIHEPPKEKKLALLKDFLGEIGLSLKNYEKVTPADYQVVMQAVAARSDAHLIQTVLLRSMNQAVYHPENKGHFGLAYKAYTHFTSPIRRYPDLLTHRAIRSMIRSNVPCKKVKRHPDAQLLPTATIYPYDLNKVLALGEQCSLTERRADEATRDVVSWLKCEYLQNRVGEIFSGVVSAVVGFGLFVELKDLFVEGLVHISSLPQDYYHHEVAQHRLVGERTRRVFRLGDELSVRVIRVSLDDRKVDFELEGHKASKRQPAAGAGRQTTKHAGASEAASPGAKKTAKTAGAAKKSAKAKAIEPTRKKKKSKAAKKAVAAVVAAPAKAKNKAKPAKKAKPKNQ
jgi:ribonuclease R